MAQDYTKAPRLYVDNDLVSDGVITATKDHAHYLLNVMRRVEGDVIRLFNGRDGEFAAHLKPLSKKVAEFHIIEKLRPYTAPLQQKHLYAVPIKKDKLQFMMEKAVELGVTDIHFILSERCENRKPNMDKVGRYIIEAAEQSERLDIPKLHPAIKLDEIEFPISIYAALERQTDLPLLQADQNDDYGILIGPEGGWSDEEIEYIKSQKNIKPVSLGNNILRAETAAIYMLSRLA